MKRVKINKLLFLFALLALFLTQSCVGGDREIYEKPVVEQNAKPVPSVKQESLLVLVEEDRPEPSKQKRASLKKGSSPHSSTRFVNSAWLGDRAERSLHGQSSLPASLRRFHDLTFITPSMALDSIARALSAQIATPIEILAEKPSKLALIDKKGIRFKGKLRDLLNLLATSFDAMWHYDRYKKKIFFTRVLTREVDFFVGAGAERFVKKISASAGTASSGASSFSTDRQILLDPWQELRRELEKQLPLGSAISFSPTSGKIILKTTPRALYAAIDLIERRNRFLQKQIYFNVQLLELTIPEEQEGRGALPLSLVALLRLADEGKVISGGGDESATPLLELSPLARSGKGKTSIEILLEALGKIGTLSVLTSTNSWTRNGKAIPIRETSEHTYVSQVKGGDIVPANLETSFYLNLLPLVLPRGRVQVDLSVALKSLHQMRNYGVGENKIQLPQVSTKTWTQEAIIPNKATLLLSGFEVRRRANGSHVMMIILITPQIEGS